MIDSTGLGAVVDECAAGSAELVVEGDCGGEAQEALEYALAQALECPGTVTLEGEEVLAGPEDRLDALTDRREVWSGTPLVFAPGSEDRGVQFADFAGELAPCVTLVTDQCLPARAPVA